MNTPEQFLEQLEKQTPAMLFVQMVNENFPDTFPSDEEMRNDHAEGDVNTFENGEGDI